MRRHDPLTHRFARTLAEVDDDPLSWWEGPQPTRGSPVAESARWVAGLVLLVLMIFAPAVWAFFLG